MVMIKNETINRIRTTQSGFVKEAEQHPAMNADIECLIQGETLAFFSDLIHVFVFRYSVKKIAQEGK